MRYTIFISFGLLLVPPLNAEPELKGSPTELAPYLASLPKTVAVMGESEVKVQADRAVVSLKVTTENRSLQDALRFNQEIRNKIMNSLTDSGLATDRVQASSRRFCPVGRRRLPLRYPHGTISPPWWKNRGPCSANCISVPAWQLNTRSRRSRTRWPNCSSSSVSGFLTVRLLG
jgi:Protein of unknown function (DUF541)